MARYRISNAAPVCLSLLLLSRAVAEWRDNLEAATKENISPGKDCLPIYWLRRVVDGRLESWESVCWFLRSGEIDRRGNAADGFSTFRRFNKAK